MSKASRDKGMRGERAVVKLLQEKGFAATKVSKMYGPDEDVSFPFLGVDRTIEVKVRGNGYKKIYDWLGSNFALVIKADRQRPLLVIDLEEAAAIAMLAEKSK